MYEVEMKAPADHEAVRERLEAHGADVVGEVTQIDTYYDAPDRDFARTDEALRIRRQSGDDGDTTVLTYKGPRVDTVSKTRVESETAVADDEAMATILECLGFEPAATVEKRRERYDLADCRVVLDEVAGLGEFVEVEFRSGVIDHFTDEPDEISSQENGIPDGSSVGANRDSGGSNRVSDGDIDDARDAVIDVLETLALDPDESIQTSYLGLLLEAEGE